jgi:hypothetical protein
MKEEIEEWRDIECYVGLYQVSNLGRVRGLDRVVPNKKCGAMKIKARILKPGLSGVHGRQYYQVSLGNGGELKRFKVHQLVAMHFISKDLSLQVDHIDNDKLNNKASNLQRLSCRDNCIKAFSRKTRQFMTGVSMTRNKKHYKALIMFKGENITLGYCDNEKDAGEKYLDAKRFIDQETLHRDNFIMDNLNSRLGDV